MVHLRPSESHPVLCATAEGPRVVCRSTIGFSVNWTWQRGEVDHESVSTNRAGQAVSLSYSF